MTLRRRRRRRRQTILTKAGYTGKTVADLFGVSVLPCSFPLYSLIYVYHQLSH